VAQLAAEPARSQMSRELRRLGFKFVTLDLEGFRSGSLNELVPLELKTRFEKTQGDLPVPPIPLESSP
jgi:pyridinium-3,5-biscarboxylic acid mononucleotide sulfurtransferase